MDLQKLRYFVAVAEELHFSNAARRLFISQPALSRAIRGLEESLRVQLFERSTRRVELTPAAVALLPDARRLLAAAAALDATVGQHRQPMVETQRRFVVGLHDAGFGTLTGHLTAAFKAAHPDVTVGVRRVPYPELDTCLPGGEVDVLLTTAGSTNSDSAIFVPLYADAMFAVLPAECPLAEASALYAADVLQLPTIYTGNVPRRLAAPFILDAFRNGDPPRATNISDPLDHEDLLLQVAYAGRFYAAEGTALLPWRKDVTYTPLADVPPLSTGVAVARSASKSSLVQDFLRTARRVTTDLLTLLPSARPLSEAAAADSVAQLAKR